MKKFWSSLGSIFRFNKKQNTEVKEEFESDVLVEENPKANCSDSNESTFRNSIPEEPVKSVLDIRYDISRTKKQTIPNNVLDIIRIEEVPLTFNEIFTIYKKEFNENVNRPSLDKALNILRRTGLISCTSLTKKKFIYFISK